MQLLLSDKINTTDATFLRELFLQRLPNNVRMVLASTGPKDLPEMAQLADKIMEVATTSPPAISGVHHDTTTQPTNKAERFNTAHALLR